MVAFFVMGSPAVSLQPKSEHAPGIFLVDLRLFLWRGPHQLHRPDRVADKAGPLLGVAGHVGAEEDPIGAEEGQPALHGAMHRKERLAAIETQYVFSRPG